VLADVLFVLYELYCVYCLAVLRAVAAEAIHCVRVGVNLHARGFIVMKGAAKHFVTVGRQAVMGQNG